MGVLPVQEGIAPHVAIWPPQMTVPEPEAVPPPATQIPLSVKLPRQQIPLMVL